MNPPDLAPGEGHPWTDWLPAHVAAWGGASVAFAVLLFLVVEARGRRRWERVRPVAAPSSPYRSEGTLGLGRAPPLIRAAALGCLVFGHLFGPALWLFVAAFRSDGVVTSLLPSFPLAGLTWLSGWLLLLRVPGAPRRVVEIARATLVTYAALLAIALAHLLTIGRWLGERSAAHQAPMVRFVLVVAGAAALQVALVRWAVRAHGGLFAKPRARGG